MKARNFILIAVSLAFFVGLIVLNSNKEKGNDWEKYYSIDKKTPYGLSAVYDLANGIYNDDLKDVNGSLYDFFDDDSLVNTNFIIIQDEFSCSPFEEVPLKRYVARGNDLLIVANDMMYSFIEQDLDLITDYSYNDFSWDSKGTYSYSCYLSDLYYPDNISNKTFFVESSSSQNSYFSDDIDYSKVTPLGFVKVDEYDEYDEYADEDEDEKDNRFSNDLKVEDYLVVSKEKHKKVDYIQSEKEKDSDYNCNFIKVKYGKGNIFICLEPNLFVNYNIVYKDNIEYVTSVFSNMPKRETFWYNEVYIDESQVSNESPLRYILNNKYLKTAYYILLFVLIVFMIFGSKRKQKAIPIIIPPQNDSKIYVDTLAQLYYSQSAERKIALMQISQFKKDISRLLHYEIDFKNKNTLQELTVLMPIDKVLLGRAIRLMGRIEVRGRYVDEQTVVIVNNFIQKIFEELKTVKK